MDKKYLICPLCKIAVRPSELYKAGTYKLYGYNFLCNPVELNGDDLKFLYEAILRVKEQLEKQLEDIME